MLFYTLPVDDPDPTVKTPLVMPKAVILADNLHRCAVGQCVMKLGQMARPEQDVVCVLDPNAHPTDSGFAQHMTFVKTDVTREPAPKSGDILTVWRRTQ